MYINKKCTKLPPPKNLADAFVEGGMWYGSLCMPKFLSDIILIIIFPPLYVFLHQKATGFKDFYQIIKNFILTCLFYFPGMIHALYIHGEACGKAKKYAGSWSEIPPKND